MTKLITLAKVSDVDVADPASEVLRGGVVSIGNFDGVHRGHVALLRRVREQADRLGGPAVAVVLDPHPASILRPDRVPPMLTWLERRAELLDGVGIEYLAVCQTSPEFLQLSAQAFFDALVVKRLAAKAMVEGPNFFFGRGRSGDVQTLQRLCGQSGIELLIVDPTMIDGDMISSTRIRGLLQKGEIQAANSLLGQPYRIRGQVVAGDRRGREIGFPTANLEHVDGIVPGPGVYGGFGYTAAGGKRLAAIHVGPNPTFDEAGSCKIEIHLLDYSADLYGQILLVDFVTSVRDIARFESVELLKQQLSRDVETIRRRLTHEDLGIKSDLRGTEKGK